MTPNATPELVTAWTSLTDMLSTSKSKFSVAAPLGCARMATVIP